MAIPKVTFIAVTLDMGRVVEFSSLVRHSTFAVHEVVEAGDADLFHMRTVYEVLMLACANALREKRDHCVVAVCARDTNAPVTVLNGERTELRILESTYASSSEVTLDLSCGVAVALSGSIAEMHKAIMTCLGAPRL